MVQCLEHPHSYTHYSTPQLVDQDQKSEEITLNIMQYYITVILFLPQIRWT